MRSRNTQNPSSVKEFVETRGQTSPAHVRPPAYHCRVTALDRCHTWIGLRPKQHKGGECSKQFPPTILAGKHRSLNCIDTYRCHVNICLDWDLELFSQIRSTTHVMEITIEPKRPLEPKLYWWFASPTFDGSNPPPKHGQPHSDSAKQLHHRRLSRPDVQLGKCLVKCSAFRKSK